MQTGFVLLRKSLSTGVLLRSSLSTGSERKRNNLDKGSTQKYPARFSLSCREDEESLQTVSVCFISMYYTQACVSSFRPLDLDRAICKPFMSYASFYGSTSFTLCLGVLATCTLFLLIVTVDLSLL